MRLFVFNLVDLGRTVSNGLQWHGCIAARRCQLGSIIQFQTSFSDPDRGIKYM